MGNTQKTGCGQPGVERSDEHPWGLKNIEMPIPIYFARNLRNNTDGLQTEYRKFITNRIYQMIPLYINNNESDVYNRFRLLDNDNIIKLVQWNMKSNNQRLGNGDITKLLEEKERNKRIFHVDGFKQLFYYPNIFTQLTHDEKVDIIRQVQNPCWFTDNKYVAAVIFAEAGSKEKSYDASQAIIAYNEKKLLQFNNLTADQDVNYAFGDSTKYLPNSIARSRMVKRVDGAFTTRAIPNEVNNKQILDKLIHGRNIINVSYEYSTPYNSGAHIVSVIIDTVKKIVYILDSEGVDECAQNIYYYFAYKLGWKNDEYQLVPIMPCGPKETPRAFQAISRGGFCQTWNIFNQELVMLNDVGVNINQTIYDEILSHADPIVGNTKWMSMQVKITLILLEFMFYIFSICKDDFVLWVNSMRDIYDSSKINYESLSSYKRYKNKIIQDYMSTTPPDKRTPESLERIKHSAEKIAREVTDKDIAGDRREIMELSYRINQSTDEYISDAYPENEKTKNLYIDQFLDNALRTFL